MREDNRIEVGQIVSAHGVKGEVKVYPMTDDVTRFSALKHVYLDIKGQAIPKDIEKVRCSKGMAFLKLSGIETMDKAEEYRGVYILIDRKDAIKLPADSYFIFELIGCDVYEFGSEIYYGKLTEVLKTGGNDVYVIKSEDGTEQLIPAIKDTICSVDVNAKKMLIRMPEYI